MNGTPKEVIENKELMNLHLPLLRADFCIAEKYVFAGDVILDCNTSVLVGKEDKYDNYSELCSSQDFFSFNGKLYFVPGGHFFIHSNSDAVLEIVNGIIDNEFSRLELC